jgi:ABC-2 type transport system ATP-binding protein
MTDMIVADGLTKLYGKSVAVDHVFFTVGEGVIFGFLGPNGAGKTTTIKMLTTLLEISEGRATIAGYEVAKAKNQVRMAIGLVPQDLTLDRDMTGHDNLRIQAKLYNVPDAVAKGKIDELLGLVDLREVAQRAVKTYSWGMQKRLSLVMGLVHTPKVLFLDEPTLGLDAQSRSLIWRYIETLNRDFKMTVFLTTHYLEEADQLCDKIAIIDGGKIKIQGSPEELKRTMGGELVELELASVDNPGLKSLLEAIPGVIKVSIEGALCDIEVLNADSMIPRLVVELAANGIKIQKVNTKVTNLDEVFLRYIGRKKSGADEADDQFRVILRERLLRERT